VAHGLIHNLDRLPELLPQLDELTFQDEVCQEIIGVVRREASGGTALLPALVAQLSPDAAALVGSWSLEDHKMSYQGLRDTIVRLQLLPLVMAHGDSAT